MIDFSQIEIPGTSSSEMSRLAAAAAGSPSLDDPQTVRDMILSSPHDLAMLKERNPPLADALLSGSLGTSHRALQLKKSCSLDTHLRTTGCHHTMVSQFYLQPDTSEHTLPK